MADIRINSLPTTASASSSDDFLALDGATNGTRKLNAYSPTFGGNLTVSGSANLTSSSLNSFIYDGAGWVWTSTGTGAGTVKGGIYAAGGEFFITANSNLGTNRFSLNSSGDATIAGNLTVSGTGTSSFAGAVTIANTASTSSYQTGLRLQSSAGSAPNTIQALEFYSSTLSAALGAIDALREAGSFASSLRFYSTTSGGALTERGRFNSYGNFLIGTTTDGGQKLQVSGSASITGTVSIGSTLNFDTGNAAGTRSIVLGSTYNSGTWLILNGSTEIGSISAAGGFKSNVGFRATVGSGPTTADYGWASSSGFYSPSANVVSLTANNSRVASWSTTAMTLDYTTASTSTTTGALVVSGGVGVAGALNVGGAISIGNTVQTAVAVASTHKVTISIGGSTYYLLATNV